MKILLLEDEYILRTAMKEILESINCLVDEYSCGESSEEAILCNKYDLFLLDVNVPGINGFELLSKARTEDIQTPAIFITSLTAIDNLEQGFELGCCDYIKKPFDMKEFKIRVNSVLKQNSLSSNDSFISLTDQYKYDTKNFTLLCNNDEVQLSKTEKSMLDLFISNKNNLVTPDMICEYIWDDYMDSANVRVQINNLRKKLDKDLIVNIRGLGYKLETTN
ncbi:MAG: response regulator transcription factor [Campylobacterota bacterium]|nr:response regulator transcription factor [Campylobacterota bacterium]